MSTEPIAPRGTRFDPARFEQRRKEQGGRWLGARLAHYPLTDSTNTRLRLLLEQEFTHGLLAVADEQTGGRGQGTRTWASDPGSNLLFSIGLRPRSADRLILLTLTFAERIAGALSDIVGEPVTLKWPNDLLLGGRKIAGILSETQFRGARLQRMVVGIGLNVNQMDFGELASSALAPVSLREWSGVQWNRESLLAHLCVLLERAYEDWEDQTPGLCAQIHGRLLGYGQWVAVHVDDRPIGLRKCLGLTPQGELLMLDEQMEVERYTHEHIRFHEPG